jgi:hypothetical protein
MCRFARPAWALVAALAALLCTACGKRGPTADTTGWTVQPVPAARDEGGWPLYEVKAHGFALALPPEWRQFDMNPATFEDMLRQSAESSPELGSLLGGLRQQIAAGVKFFGVDQATVGTGFATNVNVLSIRLPPGATLETAVADSLALLEGLQSVAQPVVHERLSGAEAVRERTRFRLSTTSPAGKPDTLAITQYFAVRGGDVYTVTLTTLADQEAKYAPTFERIGRSFRFTK